MERTDRYQELRAHFLIRLEDLFTDPAVGDLFSTAEHSWIDDVRAGKKIPNGGRLILDAFAACCQDLRIQFEDYHRALQHFFYDV